MLYTPYALPSLLSAVIMLCLLIYVLLGRRKSTGFMQFVGFMVCSIFWALGYAMSLMHVSLNQKVFWFNLAQLGPDFSPIFWLLLALDYSGHGDLLKRKWGWGVFILPILTTLLMWTNDWHHLLRLSVNLSPLNENVMYLSTVRGPWYIVETVYAYIIIAISFIVMIRFLQWSSSKKQTFILICAMIVPIVLNILDVLKINPLKAYGSTSIGFSVTGLLLAWGLFRQHFLDIKPIARNKVLKTIGDGIVVLDEQNRIVDVNPAACNLLASNHKSSSKLTGKDIRSVLSNWPDLSDQTIAEVDLKIHLTLETNHEQHFYDVTVSSLFDNRGEFVGRVSIFHDMTEEKETNERLKSQLDEIQHLQIQLRDQAIRDPLTGCFNRRYLDETLARESSRADRDDIQVGLIMLDIDYFKKVNDTYGHAIGDRILEAVGHILQKQIRLGDMVCRYGGEEFLIVLPGITLQSVSDRALTFCNQIAALRVPAPSGDLVNVTVSVGVAIYPVHGIQIKEVLEHVDQALYDAKHAGRNCVYVWDTPSPKMIL